MRWTPEEIQTMLVAVLTAATTLVGALALLVRLLIQLKAEVRSNGYNVEALRQEVRQAQTSTSTEVVNDIL